MFFAQNIIYTYLSNEKVVFAQYKKLLLITNFPPRNLIFAYMSHLIGHITKTHLFTDQQHQKGKQRGKFISRFLKLI